MSRIYYLAAIHIKHPNLLSNFMMAESKAQRDNVFVPPEIWKRIFC
jgi:hypothetical protein